MPAGLAFMAVVELSCSRRLYLHTCCHRHRRWLLIRPWAWLTSRTQSINTSLPAEWKDRRHQQVDVVHVAVVNTAHRDAALAMIAGGKAVLVEKTFAMDEAQAREIISAARRKVHSQLSECHKAHPKEL